jgi:hypothetical protein
MELKVSESLNWQRAPLLEAEKAPSRSQQDIRRRPHRQSRKARRAVCGCLVINVLALLSFVSATAQASASELKEKTLDAWNDYIRFVCSRAEIRVKESAFLEVGNHPDRRLRVEAGEIPVWREGTDYPMKVPHGLIHDWIGAVFIPKATIADVFVVTRNHERYPTIYKSAVVEARDLDSTGNVERFSMLLMRKVLFVTAAVRGEYETRYFHLDAKRLYTISYSTRLQAIENFGQRDMRILPPDRGPGYIWRLYSLARFEQSDGGVYIELEAIGLSRDVPIFFRWLLEPTVEHFPRDSIQTTLEATRNAVLSVLRDGTAPQEASR